MADHDFSEAVGLIGFRVESFGPHPVFVRAHGIVHEIQGRAQLIIGVRVIRFAGEQHLADPLAFPVFFGVHVLEGLIEEPLGGHELVGNDHRFNLKAVKPVIKKNEEHEHEKKPFFSPFKENQGVVENEFADEFVEFNEPDGFVDEDKPDGQ